MNDSSLFLFVVIALALVLKATPLPSVDPVVVEPVVVEPVEPAAPVVPEGLQALNEQRAERGLGPLVLDPELQEMAQSRAQEAARRRHQGHLGGSLAGAKYEGIGYGTDGKFRACYSYTAAAGTAVGAGMATNNGVTYCCLLVRTSRNLSPSFSYKKRVRLFRK